MAKWDGLLCAVGINTSSNHPMHFFTVKGKIISIIGGIPSMLHLILMQMPMSGQLNQSLNLIYFVDFFFTDQNYVTYSATALRKLRLILLMFL